MNPPFRKLRRIAALPAARRLSLLVVSAAMLAACSGASATPTPPAPMMTSGSESGAESLSVGWAATDSSRRRLTAVLPGSSVISAAFGGRTGPLSMEVMALVASPNIHLVTIEAGKLVVYGSCDADSFVESGRDGESSFRFEVEPSGTRPALVWSTSGEPFSHGSDALDDRGTRFARNVSQGEDLVLWFTTMLRDGRPGLDPKLSRLAGGAPHAFRSGESVASISPISVGSRDCGAIVHWSGAVAPTVKTVGARRAAALAGL